MKGVLLINLGSPDSPEPKAVKQYLKQFLLDERVIDLPSVFRNLLVRGIILNTRPKKSAEAYSKVWTKEGSPLIVYSEKLLEKVAGGLEIPTALGMRYGNPSIESALQALKDKGVDDVLVMPLYPQYAMATTETVMVECERVRKKTFPDIRLAYLAPFYNRTDYVDILAKSIKQSIQNSDYDLLLFSYHGVPERHIKKTDPFKQCKIDGSCCKRETSPSHAFCYRHQCYKTTWEVCKVLGIPEDKYLVAFQSRLGADPWLKPYTAERLDNLPSEGKKKIFVVTPAFVSDCLETLEEIAMEGVEEFLHHGGESCTVIPCLNDQSEWAELLVTWTKDWLQAPNQDQFLFEERGSLVSQS